MARENQTHQAAYDEDACPYPRGYLEPLDTSSPYIVNAALNICTAIIATFANALVLVAIRRSASIRLPSKLLLCGLALTDLGVGALVQPPYAVFLIMKAKRADSVCFFAMANGFTGSFLTSASMLTMTAIGLDRYLALFSHLKYQQLVKTWRVSLILALICLFSSLYGYTALFYGSTWVILSFFEALISFSVLSAIYVTIYKNLRHANQVQDETHTRTERTLSMARNRRIATTMMYIYVLLIVFYPPSILSSVVTFFIEGSPIAECVHKFFYTLFFISSCLNPIVFCIRVPDIKSEVKNQLKQLICRAS